MAIACYRHPQSPSVATCATCTRGLCSQCDYGPGSVCSGCARHIHSDSFGTIGARFIGALITGFFGWYIVGAINTPQRPHSAAPLWANLLGLYLGAGWVYGARFAEYPLKG